MKPESRLEIAERRIAELEAVVARQKERIKRNYDQGLPIHQSAVLLSFFEGILQNARDALATTKFTKSLGRYDR